MKELKSAIYCAFETFWDSDHTGSISIVPGGMGRDRLLRGIWSPACPEA